MKQVVKRLLGAIPVLIGVVLVIFLMLRVIPGNPVLTLLGEHYSDAQIERLTVSMGLDKPILVQFFEYIIGLFQGDMGISYKYSRAVSEMIGEAFPYTLKLACMGVVFAWVVGLVSGTIAAIRQNKLLDRLFTFGLNILMLLNLVLGMTQKSGTGFCQRSGRKFTAVDNQGNCFIFKLFLH